MTDEAKWLGMTDEAKWLFSDGPGTEYLRSLTEDAYNALVKAAGVANELKRDKVLQPSDHNEYVSILDMLDDRLARIKALEKQWRESR